MLCVLFYHNSWTDLFSVAGYLDNSLYYYCFIEIPVLNANSVDPDQMLHSVASDLGLHWLPVTLGFPDCNGLKWTSKKEHS